MYADATRRATLTNLNTATVYSWTSVGFLEGEGERGKGRGGGGEREEGERDLNKINVESEIVVYTGILLTKL